MSCIKIVSPDDIYDSDIAIASDNNAGNIFYTLYPFEGSTFIHPCYLIGPKETLIKVKEIENPIETINNISKTGFEKFFPKKSYFENCMLWTWNDFMVGIRETADVVVYFVAKNNSIISCFLDKHATYQTGDDRTTAYISNVHGNFVIENYGDVSSVVIIANSSNCKSDNIFVP